MNIDIYKGQISISVHRLGSYFVIPAGMGNLKSLVNRLLDITKFCAQNIRGPDISAIAAYGEGLAGWYMETYEMMTRYSSHYSSSRPKRLPADIIFTDNKKKSQSYVQAKATIKGDLRNYIQNGAEKILEYIQGVKLMHLSKKLSTYIIGTQIISQSDCELVIIQININ